jgi:hypothetical protein
MTTPDCSVYASNPTISDLSALQTEPRLIRRAKQIVEKWREKPANSFPEMFEDEAGLAGAYRFFSNPSNSFEDLLAPHADASFERAGPDVLLSLEDTTAFVFGGDVRREGLGRIIKDDQGFLGHFSLLASADGLRRPFGVGAAEPWVRFKEKNTRRRHSDIRRTDEERESLRWFRMVERVETLAAPEQDVIHVQDREGDIYNSVASMCAQDYRFVVRCIQNRRIEKNERGDRCVHDALEGLPVVGWMTVEISARPGSSLPERRKSHPPRKARTASVAMTATTLTLIRPRGAPEDWPERAQINVVHVFEPSPPAGEEPIEWILATTESTSMFEDIKRVISIYATRWLIEEFFKAIKTGCRYEARQLETYHALTNALALCIPIAWEMLTLRTLERTAPETPASEILAPDRLEVLKAMAKRYPLPEDPTTRDALIAIAGMGGFLIRNGRPGWLTLRRGYENLLTYEMAWRRARERSVE